MLRLAQVKINADTPEKQVDRLLRIKIAKSLRIQEADIKELYIKRRSLDARNKNDLIYSYIVDFSVNNESKVLSLAQRNSATKNNISLVTDKPYEFPYKELRIPKDPVVIIGTGPAGLFAGLYLARAGLKPILLERGSDVDTRLSDVNSFWESGKLNVSSNIQFGEGGAGTFSDGKLGTLVKDVSGRNTAVMTEFVSHGAPEKIIYDAKPHIGTDVLSTVVKNIRQEIISLGGEVRFNTCVTEIIPIENNTDDCISVICEGGLMFRASAVVLAIGHSSRDTLKMLYDKGFKMEQKPFAVGMRVQHLQSMINKSQYGREDAKNLGAASYKLTAKTDVGRGVFSFCMCPGGYVVNASSEDGGMVVNGMSYSGRNGENANSAIVVSVEPSDYPSDHPLSGVDFQRDLEKKAFELADGKIPLQRFGAFKDEVYKDKSCNERIASSIDDCPDSPIKPCVKGQYAWADLTGIMTDEMNHAFCQGMEHFDKLIPGFGAEDVILAGVESRTSCPVRIIRNDELISSFDGIFPCGEGAGYAGGITSAAMDGIKVAEAVAARMI